MNGRAALPYENADPSVRTVVEAGTEGDLSVDDHDAQVAVHDDLERVLAGGQVAWALQLYLERNVARDLPLGIAGDRSRPSVEDQTAPLRFETDDVRKVAVRTRPQQKPAFRRVGPDAQARRGEELLRQRLA